MSGLSGCNRPPQTDLTNTSLAVHSAVGITTVVTAGANVNGVRIALFQMEGATGSLAGSYLLIDGVRTLYGVTNASTKQTVLVRDIFVPPGQSIGLEVSTIAHFLVLVYEVL